MSDHEECPFTGQQLLMVVIQTPAGEGPTHTRVTPDPHDDIELTPQGKFKYETVGATDD